MTKAQLMAHLESQQREMAKLIAAVNEKAKKARTVVQSTKNNSCKNTRLIIAIIRNHIENQNFEQNRQMMGNVNIAGISLLGHAIRIPITDLNDPNGNPFLKPVVTSADGTEIVKESFSRGSATKYMGTDFAPSYKTVGKALLYASVTTENYEHGAYGFRAVVRTSKTAIAKGKGGCFLIPLTEKEQKELINRYYTK